MLNSYSYQAALAASESIHWRVEDIIGGEKRLDFTRQDLDAGEPGPTTRAGRVREAPRQPVIGLAKQTDGEAATLREAIVHAASDRKENCKEWWLDRGSDARTRRSRMWLPIDHRDHDGNAARNLTRGTTKGLPRISTRVSHSIHRHTTRSSRPADRAPFAPHRLASSPG